MNLQRPRRLPISLGRTFTGRARTLARVTLVAALLAVTGTVKAEAEFKLRWAHYLSNTDFLAVEKKFAKTIEERTNGRVTIDIAYSGGLGKDNEIMILAGRGAFDMASAVPGYYADRLLFWRATQTPFVFDTPAKAIEAMTQANEELPYFREELDRRMNVRFLFQQPLGSYYLTGPSPNCDSVEGLSGKKVRSFGADVPKMHNAIGAVPISISTTEIYEALSRGILDYSFLNRGNILTNQWHKVGKYSCGPIMSVAGHMVVIGNRTWQRLPKDIQDIFTEEGKKSQLEYVNWLNGYEDAAMKTIESQGGVFKSFPTSELAKWKHAAPDFLADWVKDMERRGPGKEAREVADRWRAAGAK